MNRRSFLQSTAALAVGALVPTWFKWPEVAQPINLEPFCAAEPFRKFDARKPFVQEAGSNLFTYATDGRIAVRVPADFALATAPDAKLPPCSGLRWWQGMDEAGWRPWPRKNYLLASDSECPRCNGFGVYPMLGGCKVCDGSGYTGHGGDDFLMYSKKCAACHGGNAGPLCTHCNGNAIGIFPGIQPIESGVYVGAEFDAKMRQHLQGIEYRVIDARIDQAPIQLRFAGGCGLLMTLNQQAAEKRIREAKQRKAVTA